MKFLVAFGSEEREQGKDEGRRTRQLFSVYIFFFLFLLLLVVMMGSGGGVE